MAVWAQTFFLNSNSIILFMLIEYHNLTMFLMTNILVFLLAILLFLITGRSLRCCPWNKDNKTLEILWTIFPAYWLAIMAVPSLGNLYRIDISKCEYDILFKAIGNQWYWSYEYNIRGIGGCYRDIGTAGVERDNYFDIGAYVGRKVILPFKLLEGEKALNVGEVVVGRRFGGVTYDGGVVFVSYLEDLKFLEVGDYRLLEVDNRAVCPGLLDIRVHITSFDVIHSWTIPSVRVKVDAVPGRLNCATFQTLGHGVYYGQCSEICGAKHSFIPICLEAIPYNWFRLWVKEFQVGE